MLQPPAKKSTGDHIGSQCCTSRRPKLFEFCHSIPLPRSRPFFIQNIWFSPPISGSWASSCGNVGWGCDTLVSAWMNPTFRWLHTGSYIYLYIYIIWMDRLDRYLLIFSFWSFLCVSWCLFLQFMDDMPIRGRGMARTAEILWNHVRFIHL